MDEQLIQLNVGGKDEITTLGDAINSMLKRIYDSKDLEQRNIKLSEKNYQTTQQLEQDRERLDKQLKEAQRINKVMVNRELKMIDLKKRLAKYEPVDMTSDNSTDEAPPDASGQN